MFARTLMRSSELALSAWCTVCFTGAPLPFSERHGSVDSGFAGVENDEMLSIVRMHQDGGNVVERG